MANGSTTTEDKRGADLAEIIAELRIALGGVPEVAKLYGKPESSSETVSPRDDVGEMKDAYSTPDLEFNKAEDKSKYTETVSLRDEVGEVKGAYGTPDLELNEAEDESKDVDSTEKSRIPYTLSVGDKKEQPAKEPYTVAVEQNDAKEGVAHESESEDKLMYVGDLDQLNPEAPRNSGAVQPTPVGVASNFEKVRKEADHRLAKLAKFLPDNVREALDKKFEDAIKLAQPKSDEAYQAATEALTKLQSSLDSKAPELRTTENNYLRKQVQATLDRSGDTLEPVVKKAFVDRFATLNTDLPDGEGEARTQLEGLQELSSEIDGAIQERLKAISDLNVDFERLTPIVERALSIESDKKADLQKARDEVKAGFEGKFVSDGLSLEEIQGKVKDLDAKVREIFKNFTLDDALEEQKNSLPASPDSLEPKGPALGRGAFGEVFELKNDGATKLVGKSFSDGDANAKKEMEHEAEIYARLGEHPNIAKCYGIHEVDGKSMLVMDKIEGENVEDVLNNLNKRLRKGKISREEYLAATQHIFKGTLMGLAHMESMGLVHKDIKGDNVKFDTRTNEAVLIDMGLAQSEGAHENPKNFFPIAPPEQFNQTKTTNDKIVTTFWDSFTVGKMLFEEMERDTRGDKHLLVTGGDTLDVGKGRPLTMDDARQIVLASRQAQKRTGPDEFVAEKDADGQLIGQALKPSTDPNEAGKAGRYGAETEYVDFINRLTHPDPKQRMSPSEALRHPFMTDTFMSGAELDNVFGVASTRQKTEEHESDDEEGDESMGPRIDTDALADSYHKKVDDSRFRAEPLPTDDEDEEESTEENKGPRIDTDALAEAYGKEKKEKYDSLLEEMEEESTEERKKSSSKGKKKSKK